MLMIRCDPHFIPIYVACYPIKYGHIFLRAGQPCPTATPPWPSPFPPGMPTI